MTDVMTTSGEKIRRHRRGAGLSQEALSRASGVHKVTIARLETGKNVPDLATLQKLAGALGVGVSELIGDE